MELIDTLRSTGAAREFVDEPIDEDTVYRLLDTARFAPNGGNRQAWKVILVRDASLRARLRDLYLEGWYPYLAQSAAGLCPWAPITDEEAERTALEQTDAIASAAASGAGGFAEHLDEVPVLLVVLADLRRLAAVDRGFDRYTFIGGASVYPFAWSLLLAARAEGLGGVITTMATRHERQVSELLRIPPEYAVAAMLAIGRPTRQPKRLKRARVEDFATVDTFDGTPLREGGDGHDRAAAE